MRSVLGWTLTILAALYRVCKRNSLNTVGRHNRQHDRSSRPTREERSDVIEDYS